MLTPIITSSYDHQGTHVHAHAHTHTHTHTCLNMSGIVLGDGAFSRSWDHPVWKCVCTFLSNELLLCLQYVNLWALPLKDFPNKSPDQFLGFYFTQLQLQIYFGCTDCKGFRVKYLQRNYVSWEGLCKVSSFMSFPVSVCIERLA